MNLSQTYDFENITFYLTCRQDIGHWASITNINSSAAA